MLTSITSARLTESVLAVPPLCRNADFSFNPAENQKLIRHIEAGGVATLLYGGNANLYHAAPSEFLALLELLQSLAAPQTLMIPSVGPAYGTALDQVRHLKNSQFPTAMLLPMQGATTSEGIDLGLRRLADAAGIPLILYIRADNYIEPARIAKLAADRIISAVKYAVIRDNPSVDPYLQKICDHVNPQLLISGIGEQPALTHLRDFKLGGFTAGIVCIAPKISAAVLKAIRAKDYVEVERLRKLCQPLEDLRNTHNPIRVLHEAVRLAGIANTGPLTPLLSNLPEQFHDSIQSAARTLLALNT